MKRTMLLAVLGLTAPAVALAVPSEGSREFTIAGSGTSDSDFDSTTFGATAAYGVFISDATEVGVRQTITVANSDDDDSWNGATRIYGDYHFGTGPWQPYLGASVGGIYGEDTEEAFTAGPEAGVKYYVKDAAFVFGQAEYQFRFDEVDEADDAFDDGAYFYTVGAGFNF